MCEFRIRILVRYQFNVKFPVVDKTYLDVYHNTEMVFDSTTPDVDVEKDFPKEDWSTSVYLDEDGSVPSEVIPEDAPVPKGKGMMMTLFC